MKNELQDAEFAEDLLRLDRQAEQNRAISLEVCSMVVADSIEWLPATEWAKTSP
jgi:hypothetical protein